MKIILGTHYRLSFVLAHCKLLALNKAAHIRLLHSIMWRIFYTFSGLFLTCLPHYKLTDAGLPAFVSDACFFLDRHGYYGLGRGTEGFIVYAEAYRSYLTVLHTGKWMEAITARAPSPPLYRLPLPILCTGNWSCRKLLQDCQMNALHCYKGQW